MPCTSTSYAPPQNLVSPSILAGQRAHSDTDDSADTHPGFCLDSPASLFRWQIGPHHGVANWLGDLRDGNFESPSTDVDAETRSRLEDLYQQASNLVVKAFEDAGLQKALVEHFLKHVEDKLPSHPILARDIETGCDYDLTGVSDCDYDMTGDSDCDCDYDLTGVSDCNYDMTGESDCDCDCAMTRGSVWNAVAEAV